MWHILSAIVYLAECASTYNYTFFWPTIRIIYELFGAGNSEPKSEED